MSLLDSVLNDEDVDQSDTDFITSILGDEEEDDYEISASRMFELSKRPQREDAASKALSSIESQGERFLEFGGDPKQVHQIIEQDLVDPDKNSSFGIRFFDLLDKVGFMQYALFGGAKAIADGKDMGGVMTEFFKGFSNVLPQAALDSLFGTNLQEGATQTTFSDVLKSSGMGKLGTTQIFAPIMGDVSGRGALGLVGDIVFDPLNALTFGAAAISKASKIGRKSREFKIQSTIAGQSDIQGREYLIKRAENALGFDVPAVDGQLNEYLKKLDELKSISPTRSPVGLLDDTPSPLFRMGGESIEYTGQDARGLILEIAEKKAASEHGLVGFKMPFARSLGIIDSERIILQGEPLAALANAIGKTKFGDTVLKSGEKVRDSVKRQMKELFSTKSENDVVNSLVQYMKHLGNFETGIGAKRVATEMGNIVESYNLKHQDFNSMIDFLQTDLAAGVDSLKASKFEKAIEARLTQDPSRFGTDKFADFMDIASDKSNPLSNDASTIIENVGKETLTSRSTLKEKIDILEAAEIGGRNSEVIAGKRKAMISMTESFHQMAENEIKAGLLSSTLEIYFPHMLKPSIARELGVTSGFSIGLTGMPSGINVDPGFVKHRKHLTVEDFNESMVEAFRQKGLKTPTGGEHLLDWDGIEIPDRFGDPMPILAETDPRILVQMRASSSAAALNTDEFLKKIVDPEIAGLSHGESYARKIAPGSKIPKGYVPVNIEGSSASGVLKDHVFHPEVAKHIEKYVNVTGDAKQMVQFHKGYRKIFEFWKGWTLGIYPAYHVRNEIGNLWNNHLADVTPRTQVIGDKRYKLGVYGASMDVAKGKEGYLITKAGKRIDYDEFRDMVDKNGITGSGIFAVENPEFYYKDPGSAGKQALVFGKGHDMSQSIVDAILKPFGREKLAGDISSLGVKLDESPSKNLLLGLGFMVGKGIENNARIAHFMQKIIDGETAISAGESVAKHLFDYTDLTKSERFFKQNLLPFYTFRRKNIPLQITNLMAQPAKFTMIRKFKSGFENDDDVPATSSLSEFLRENVPIRMKKGADGRHEYFLLGNWLPAADIETLLGVPSKSNISSVRLLEEGFKMIFPGVSRAAELAFNFETFRGRPIQDFPGQRETFMGQESILGQPITRPFVRTMESFRLLSEVDRFLKADLTVGQSLLRTATGARLFPFDKEREQLNRIFQTSTDMRKLASQQEREQTIDQIKLSRRGIR